MSDAIKLHARVQELERELNAANSKLSTVFQWINRNHPDGFIDSLTHLQNLERVTDLHHGRIDQLEAALSGRTVSYSNCNAMAGENAAMREAIKEAHDALEGCQEDTCELIAERDWWKNEPRCGYSARWAEMRARLAKAESTLSKLQPYIK